MTHTPINAFRDNPLRSRSDLQGALLDLVAPLWTYFSPGAARVCIGLNCGHYADAAAELEAFARPLWGLVPLAAGGGVFDGWERYRRGLANGSDPAHPEYWGAATHGDQRLVEMAALGFALTCIPEHVWMPLQPAAQQHLAEWLGRINRCFVSDNNWLFFRVLVNLGLAKVGAPYNHAAMEAALDRLESFYLGAGWYSDGPTMQRDYYVAFAIHFYSLIYAALAGQQDPQRAARFRERAAQFAQDHQHWFAADGAALPFGRSLSYRFAQGSFWGALAFADVEALPWGVIKGLALRHLRWWAQRPIFNGDGTLSIGYGYPNPLMAENYNTFGGPYWALKFFLPLALPESHPFWQATEVAQPNLPAVQPLPHAGMVVCRSASDGHVFALSGGQHALWARHGEAKYAKFVYSTAFGFSVAAGGRGLEQGAFDSMLAISDDNVHFRPREAPVSAIIEGDWLRSIWRPWPDVEVETWLIPAPPWHIRVHRLRTARQLWCAEGGFALDRTGDDRAQPLGTHERGVGFALARYPAGVSGLRDLRGERAGTVLRVDPNTNLLVPRTVLPTLASEHQPGEDWLACAVLGLPDPVGWERIWEQPPAPPTWLQSV